MSEQPMIGARVPQEWQCQIKGIALATGRTEAQIVREAIGKYLGKNDPTAVRGAIADLEERVTKIETKLSGLGRLVG
ncbi:CopG family transcriptional regulator [Argonema antarcticum]|uniref:CopG family transcriptional regulator n=1 Tax=Argonema antarcticum TaxID=2942763 RepID=UPI00201120E3|nr:CopG family transcriptional regulator [Argonema antarcticum]MCL1475696.1 CopG family transcriptional regulator [Argonema antarcticum A004/B2]